MPNPNLLWLRFVATCNIGRILVGTLAFANALVLSTYLDVFQHILAIYNFLTKDQALILNPNKSKQLLVRRLIHKVNLLHVLFWQQNHPVHSRVSPFGSYNILTANTLVILHLANIISIQPMLICQRDFVGDVM